MPAVVSLFEIEKRMFVVDIDSAAAITDLLILNLCFLMRRYAKMNAPAITERAELIASASQVMTLKHNPPSEKNTADKKTKNVDLFIFFLYVRSLTEFARHIGA